MTDYSAPGGSTGNDGGLGGSTFWTILKIIFGVIALIFALRLLFWIIGGALSLFFSLLPLLIVAGAVYFLYKAFSKPKVQELPAGQPHLLDFKDEDPLEQRFRELEAEEHRVNAMLKELDKE